MSRGRGQRWFFTSTSCHEPQAAAVPLWIGLLLTCCGFNLFYSVWAKAKEKNRGIRTLLIKARLQIMYWSLKDSRALAGLLCGIKIEQTFDKWERMSGICPSLNWEVQQKSCFLYEMYSFGSYAATFCLRDNSRHNNSWYKCPSVSNIMSYLSYY